MRDSSATVVLSGIRATGELHLGNYLGAVQFFVNLARKPGMECYFFIADLHTLTTRTDPEALQRDLRGIVLDWLAAGLDPERSVIYAQSSVPETCELSCPPRSPWLCTLVPPGDFFMRRGLSFAGTITSNTPSILCR